MSLLEAEAVRRPGSVGYVQLLRQNRNFRRLWLAEVASFLGDWFNTIALFTAVERLSGSTQAVAGVFVAKMLPIVAMTPIAGPLIDRFDRRRLLVITDLARAVCALGLIAAYRVESLPLLMVLLVVMMCFSGIFIPAKTAVLPQVAPPPQLGAANALSGGTWSAMLALGAALGGVVTGLVGIEIALACDALTFLISAAILVRLPRLGAGDPQDPARSKRQSGFFAGLRYLTRRPYLAAVLSLKSLMALAGGSLAMLPVFGTRVFETGGPSTVGVLYAARGLGALVGSMFVPQLFGDGSRAMRRFVAPALVIISLSHLGLSQATSIAQAAAAYFGTAVGGGMIWVSSGTLGQMAAANRFRGRVFSLEWGAMTLVLSAVAGLSGWLVDHTAWTVRDVSFASGLVISLPLLGWLTVLRYRRRGEARLRREQEQPPAGVAPAVLEAAHARWLSRWSDDGDEG